MWLSVMVRYAQLCRQGVDMLPIQYADWHSAAQETAVSLLTHCNCLPQDLTAVFATLTQDSQAHTPLAQDNIRDENRILQPDERAELQAHLQHHGFA